MTRISSEIRLYNRRSLKTESLKIDGSCYKAHTSLFLSTAWTSQHKFSIQMPKIITFLITQVSFLDNNRFDVFVLKVSFLTKVPSVLATLIVCSLGFFLEHNNQIKRVLDGRRIVNEIECSK